MSISKRQKGKKVFPDIIEYHEIPLDLQTQLRLVRLFIRSVIPQSLYENDFIERVIEDRIYDTNFYSKPISNMVFEKVELINEKYIWKADSRKEEYIFSLNYKDYKDFVEIGVPSNYKFSVSAERFKLVFDFLYKYKKISRILLANPKGFCVFPESCKRFPCETLDCNGDQCINGYVSKGY